MHGESCPDRVVKKVCISITKMKISHFLCVQFTPEQFSGLVQVTTYPGMDLFLRFYSVSGFPMGGQIFLCTQKIEIFHEILKILDTVQEASRKLLGAS